MRYQITNKNYNKYPTIIPEGVKLLIIINIIVFLLIELSGEKHLFFYILGLVPTEVINEYKIWQTFTYLFIHGDFFHIFFNLFVLWMFGKDLENDWGKKEFLFYYFTCGIGSGLLTTLISNNLFIPIVGASGAIYGILVAYGFSYPNKLILLYGIIPIKTKFMVLGIGIIAFFATISSSQSSISHITHLFGMIIGIIYFSLNWKWKKLYLWYLKLRLKSLKIESSSQDFQKTISKVKINKILDKLNDKGWDSLTNKEEELLIKASKQNIDDEYIPN